MEKVRETATTSMAVPQRFEDFYKAYRPQVARALVLALGDRDLGIEAADEAMVRVYQRWGSVRSYGNPVGWTYRVGVNWGRSRLRRRRRETVGAGIGEVDPVLGSDVDVRDALAMLPLDQRAVVVLRYYLGFSTAEVAEVLGVASGTVKSRLSRGLDRLGRSLGGER